MMGEHKNDNNKVCMILENEHISALINWLAKSVGTFGLVSQYEQLMVNQSHVRVAHDQRGV